MTTSELERWLELEALDLYDVVTDLPPPNKQHTAKVETEVLGQRVNVYLNRSHYSFCCWFDDNALPYWAYGVFGEERCHNKWMVYFRCSAHRMMTIQFKERGLLEAGP